MSVHIAPKTLYISIFGALMVLTVVTVAAAFVNLGNFNAPVALAIATLKATLVVQFFMHVKYSSKMIKLVVATSLFFLFILLTETLMDFATRGWVSVPTLMH